jgi:amidase
MDSRMPLFGMLGLEIGDAHVIRNAGGVITEDTIRSLTISQHVLGTREILLVHHTQCGLQATDDVSFADLVEQATGRRPPWAARAFVDVDAERALAEAAGIGPDDARPFAGVPVAVKASVPVADRPLTYASRLLAKHRPDHSAYLVRRLRDAGFVIVGTTNMSEFGILPTTEPRATGPTRNPWDAQRTPGGSSGGSAAAVAAGMVSVAHGSDGGGSIRIPAACCGVVGMKPSRGRVSPGPDLGASFLGVEGVLTRTVAESAQLLDLLGGYEPGDATWAPRPVEPYAEAIRRHPGRLRIAMTLENPMRRDVEPDAARAVHEAAAMLREFGHEVVEATPPFPGPDSLDVFLQVFGPGVALAIMFGELLAGRPAREDEIEPLSRAVADFARGLPSTSYLAALSQLQALARSTVAFFADHELLLTPLLASRPLPIGELHGCGERPLEDLARSGGFAPFTALFNVTGQPAISVPLGFGADGLPSAVQLVGRPLAEDTVLQVAAQLELARPWAQHLPPVDA